MTQYTKPTVLPAWGESAGGADVLQPTNDEIQAGWPLSNVPPSRKRFNWILKYLAQGVRYMMQMGIPVWDATEDYPVNARVMGSDGKTYKALQTSTNQNPTTAPAYWQLWGTDGRDDQLQLTTAFTTAGAAPNFTLTPLPAPAALTANLRFRVKFHAAGAGADQINIAGLGNKAIKQYDSTGMKVAATVVANQLADIEYDGTDLVLLGPVVPVQAGDCNTSMAGGTADALTGDYTPNVIALENGLTLFVRAAVANTTTTPTFAPDGLTAKTIVKGNDIALAAGDIAGAGHWLEMNFDTTLDKWVLQNPARGVTSSMQPSITGSATLNGTTNNTVQLTGIVTTLGLELGDVIRIQYSGYDKLHTVESITDDNSIIVNYEHAGNRGNGSLKLSDTTASATVTRIAKWHNAPIGLGQAWVDVKNFRALNTIYTNNTGRMISANVAVRSGMGVEFRVDSILVSQVDMYGGNPAISVGGVVPAGSTYKLAPFGTPSLHGWLELR